MACPAQEILDELLNDMKGRRGLRQFFDDLDEDVRVEIENAWLDIIDAGIWRSFG